MKLVEDYDCNVGRMQLYWKVVFFLSLILLFFQILFDYFIPNDFIHVNTSQCIKFCWLDLSPFLGAQIFLTNYSY